MLLLTKRTNPEKMLWLGSALLLLPCTRLNTTSWMKPPFKSFGFENLSLHKRWKCFQLDIPKTLPYKQFGQRLRGRSNILRPKSSLSLQVQFKFTTLLYSCHLSHFNQNFDILVPSENVMLTKDKHFYDTMHSNILYCGKFLVQEYTQGSMSSYPKFNYSVVEAFIPEFKQVELDRLASLYGPSFWIRTSETFGTNICEIAMDNLADTLHVQQSR